MTTTFNALNTVGAGNLRLLAEDGGQGESGTGNPILNIAIFVIFIVITMAIVMRAGKSTKEASDFYTGGATFSGKQNGLAIAGDYLSAASFLGIVGAVALNGYDGFLYSIGFFVAWLVALLLVAEPLRNTGKFTMADVLSFRLKQKPVRMAAAFGTLFVSLFYLIAQMAGAGSLVSVLLDIHDKKSQAIVVAVVGAVMIAYVLFGGMKGNFSHLLQQAIDMHAASGASPEDAQKILEPGLKYGKTATTRLDFVSLALALVLGTAGLPHVLMRFYTVPTAREARRSVTWAIGLIGAFYLMTLVLGYGAAALVGPERIKNAPGGANAAAPLLALEIGGSFVMALISAVAFATVLAVVAGLAITASASVAHDIYHSIIRDGKSTEEEQVRVSRITVVVIGVVSIILGILAMGQNVAFLVALAFAIAASANLPTILYSLYWKEFNTTGALASMYTGLVCALVLIIFSPAVSGTDKSMFTDVDFHWFPLNNPGLISIPAAFIAGFIGTKLGKPDNFDDLQAEMEVRSLTGVGVEAPVDH